jgi:hypothetical protein
MSKEIKDSTFVNAPVLVFSEYWQPTLEKLKICLEITTELLTERAQYIWSQSCLTSLY